MKEKIQNPGRNATGHWTLNNDMETGSEIHVSELELRDAVNSVAYNSLKTTVLWVGVLFIVAAIQPLFRSWNSAWNALTVYTIAIGLALLCFRLILQRWRIPHHWVHLIAAMIYCLVLFGCVLPIFFGFQLISYITNNLIVMLIAGGFLLFSTSWFFFLIIVTFAVSLSMYGVVEDALQWSFSTYTFFFGLIVAFIIHRVRLNATRRLETLRIQARIRNEQLNKAKQVAEQMIQAKDRFFANISHEFRTPLTLILGPVEKLLARAEDGRNRKELECIDRNAGRLLQLINQLLDLSKLEHGKMQLHKSQGNFVAFIKGVVASFASHAESKNITLQLHTFMESLVLDFDHEVIEKIVNNLMSNALKFTPEGGKISVECSVFSGQLATRKSPLELSTEYCIQITVADTGIGITAEHLPYIFDRYYQADASATNEYAGTGIGLALVKELIDLYGGNICVTSIEGEGTTFTVRLPVESGQPSAFSDQPSAVSNQQPTTNNQQPTTNSQQPITNNQQPASSDQDIILIIEDHAELRSYIRERLEPQYSVLEAKDGEQGIALAIEHVPDLVISDVMMPKKNGYEVCEFLKENEITSHIPVILLTAKAQTEDRIEGLETGADDYLTKPFNAEELRVRVKNLIGLRRRLLERFGQNGVLKPREMAIAAKDQGFLDHLRAIVAEHINDKYFDVETFSRKAALSRAQLHRKLRALTNQNCSRFILSVRLQRAIELLQKNSLTISEIAYRAGFSDVSYFGKCFKKEFGCTPGEFIKKSTRQSEKIAPA